MIPLSLREVADATGGSLRGEDVAIDEITTDSRSVPDGSLFVALRGDTHDGHDHVGEALAAGAVASLVEDGTEAGGPGPAVVVQDTWQALQDLARTVRERVDPTVVAVTGSVGKTTTKDLIAAACGGRFRTVSARGSYNNEVGVPLTCLACVPDTEVLVVEVGSRGVGHIEDLMPVVQPDVTVVTAVSGAHLEMFGDLDTVARAKGELVAATAAGGVAILNADDPRVAGMADLTDAAVVRFGYRGAERPGEGPAPDVRGADVSTDGQARASFRAETPWGRTRVRLPLAGVHHVGNALAALAVAGHLGVDLDRSAAALADAPVSSWRSEIQEAGGVTVLNDAYNANPASMEAALRALVAIDRPEGARTWAVLGVMAELGETADEEHRGVGRAVVELGVDRLIVVGDDARGILEGARAAGFPEGDSTSVEDAEAAGNLVLAGVGEGDVVLVKASRVGGLEKVADRLLSTDDIAAGDGATEDGPTEGDR